jgi:hypothetical protein
MEENYEEFSGDLVRIITGICGNDFFFVKSWVKKISKICPADLSPKNDEEDHDDNGNDDHDDHEELCLEWGFMNLEASRSQL